MVAGFFDLCYRGDLEGVQAALQGGFHVNTKDRGVGETGLIWALHGSRLQLADAWKHTAVVRLLLEQEGVDVNIREDLPKKECLLSGIARIRGGGPCPKVLALFSPSTNL